MDQPVVDRNSIRFSFHWGLKELGLGIDYHHGSMWERREAQQAMLLLFEK